MIKIEVSKEQKENMLHALGLYKINKYWKPKTVLNKCYRNRFVVYSEDTKLNDLVLKGLMGMERQRQNKDSVHEYLYFYYVTEEGVEFLQKGD